MSERVFSIPRSAYYVARAIDATSRFWVRAGNLETLMLRGRLAGIPIDRPIYVGSMARSGTTIVTEMIGAHPEVAHHYYRDCINIWTPAAWDWIASRLALDETPVERIHDDGLMVTPRSPEAVEEIIWMRFFDFLHDEGKSNVLDRETRNPAFERFYRDHLQKLLQTRGAPRYLTKGNYITARMHYVLRLFPDARFIVPVRHPVNHIASCLKQERVLRRKYAADPMLNRMTWLMGHREFGQDKRCINLGDRNTVNRIRDFWQQGRSIEGWSLYWSEIYSHILQQIDDDPALAKASLIVRFEDLCRDSARSVDRILEHCALSPDAFGPMRHYYIEKLHEPTYYKPAFDEREIGLVREFTSRVAGRLGYENYPAA